MQENECKHGTSLERFQCEFEEANFINRLINASLPPANHTVVKVPPIGIMPKWCWDEKVRNQRIADLLATIQRYKDAGVQPLQEWIDELMGYLI